MTPQEWLAQDNANSATTTDSVKAQGISPQEWLAQDNKAQQQPKEKDWADTAASAAVNFLPSTGNAIKGVANMAVHPVDTVQGIGDMIVGGVNNAMPESLQPEMLAEQRKKAGALGDVYADRYGSVEGFKKTLAADPAAIMMDASMIFGGAGVAAKAAATAATGAGAANAAGSLARVADIANKAAVVTNPLYLPAKGTIAVAKSLPAMANYVKNPADIIGANPEKIAQASADAYNPLDNAGQSLSAAGTTKAAQRQAMAESFPVPFTGEAGLTEGQLRRNPTQQAFESDAAKLEHGLPLVKRTLAQERAVHQNIDQLFEDTGATTPDLYQAGDVVSSHINKLAKEAKANVNAEYAAAAASPEGDRVLQLNELTDYLNSNRASTGTAKILNTTKQQMINMGWAVKDPLNRGHIIAQDMPLRDVEKLRQTINANTGFESPNQFQAGKMKELLDAKTDLTGGDLYKSARAKHADYAETFKNTPIIADLIKTKRGTNQRAVALEDVYKKTMLNSSYDSAATVKKILTESGENGVQAWKELKGRVVANIADDAKRIIAPNAAGEAPVSVAGINKLITHLDKSGKLDLFFDKPKADMLRDLGEISKTLMTHPAGAVNTSNTGRVVAQILMDSAATGAVTGIPLPVMTGIKALKKGIDNARTEARIKAALNPRVN